MNRAALLEALENAEDEAEFTALSSLIDELTGETTTTIEDENPTFQSVEASKHDRHRSRVSVAQTAQTRAAQNIGYAPRLPEDPERRAESDASLLAHLELYYQEAFVLEWSEDHLRLIAKLERAITEGELSALAMPRGSGKTTIIIRAAIWAILTGRRSYVAIVAATETKAQKLLRGIKTEILHNKELLADYGRELHCLFSLGNRAAMSGGQHIHDVLTGVEWNVGHLNFGFARGPDPVTGQISDVRTNNSIIVTMGITGDIRGEQTTTPDGSIRRPDLVLIDDPQTKQSAGSKSQCEKRHETMMGDVLGMAGPGKTIAGLCACTVVYANDLADRILDRELSPEWQGEKCKMVYQWPIHMNMWDEYKAIYEYELRNELGHDESTKLIIDNFELMHEGSEVGWESRFDRDKELSALHHAFNLRIRDEGAFAAEYQNSPIEGFDELPFDLNAELISRRTVPNLRRDEVPAECETITCAVDVQKRLLFYVVCAWTVQGRCYIIDYGCYPDQKRDYFIKRDAPRSLQDAAGTDEFEASLKTGLRAVTDYLLDKEYEKGDGTTTAIDKLCIDARWGDSTHIVRRFCRESKHRARIHPSMGVYIGCNSKKWQRLSFDRRDKKGIHCKLQPPKDMIGGRPELLIDTNFWKTFVAERLTINLESERAIVLFDDKPSKHRMFAEHQCDETPEKKVGKNGDVVIEWKQPKGAENDLWDCLVYNCAMASTLGVKTHDPNLKRLPSKPARAKASQLRGGAEGGPRETARERMERMRKEKE